MTETTISAPAADTGEYRSIWSHLKELEFRQGFVDIDGVPQPAPAPRFSRTQPSMPAAPPRAAVPADRVWI